MHPVFRNFVFAALLIAAPAAAHSFSLTSSFPDGGSLPSSAVYEGFGCHGPNRSPELRWTNPPPGTKSLAVTVYDPDAPTGSGWWHWVVFDLPPGTRRLAEGVGPTALPSGALTARNDYGDHAFGGACPPKGDKPHRYVFTVHALDVSRLGIDADASPAKVGYLLGTHRLATATTTATYGR